MIVEFLGGPLDGELRNVPDDCWLWRVPMLSGAAYRGFPPSASPRIREGVYRRWSATPRYMEWEGER